MGIMTNLQVFLDPEYEDYDADLAATLGDSGNSVAANEWTTAIGPEITTMLLPMAPGGFIDAGSASFILTSGDFDSDTLPGALDELMDDIAGMMSDLSGQISAPSAPFDSANQIFDPTAAEGLEPEYTPAQICERAESRITEWLMTGTFTSYYISPGSPPSGSPGVPMTPWVMPPGEDPPEPPDEDGDGYSDQEEIDADTDPEDADEYPGSDD